MKRRRVVILSAIALALAGVICMLALSADRPPYQFIAKLHGTRAGQRIEMPPRGSGAIYVPHSSWTHTVDFDYVFDTPREWLEEEIRKELGQKGSVMTVETDPVRDFIVIQKKSARTFRGPYYNPGNLVDRLQIFPTTVSDKQMWVVRCYREPTWLDAAWARVKGWFGQK